MLRHIKKGQTSLEYLVFIIIVLGAFVAMQNYFKRGIQGRWKASLDQLGDQYDPRFAFSDVEHRLISNTTTYVVALNDAGGYYTVRQDTTNSVETKQGYITAGQY